MATETAPSPEKNPARFSVDLEPEHIKQLKDAKPGTVIQIVMVVKISSIELRKPYGESDKKYVGYLSGEIDEMKIAKHAKNVFEELAKTDMSED